MNGIYERKKCGLVDHRAYTSWENSGVKRDWLHNTINRQNRLSLRDRWVDAVFLDAAKAFHKVAHSFMFKKLPKGCCEDYHFKLEQRVF